MKIPLSWLREHVEVTVEPGRLADDLTLVGLAVDGIEGDGDDAVLDLDITTNRVDCMNVRGVAREVSVLYRTPLKPLDVAFEEAGAPAGEALSVEVEAPDLCPRFCARILDVRLGPSPAWLRDRLELVGVRPINNVVDLTNYVMMETGHPSHAFDLEGIPERRLRVRWANAGEGLRTLDGVDRELGEGIGVVAGPEAPLALAGIMGGAQSEVSDQTTSIALEAAYWTPLAIRRAARRLGMHTEASHRFERGADPEAPPAATARIAHLLGRLGAGQARPGLVDRRPVPAVARRAVFRLARASALLGTELGETECRRVLDGLGFAADAPVDGGIPWVIPSWRSDVVREADLTEEVGRHHGVDRIAATLPAAQQLGGLRPEQVRLRRLRERLVGLGLLETVQHTLVSSAAMAGVLDAPVRLKNPLSEEQDVLRSSLVVPGLVQALRRNLHQGVRDVALFEIGRVFPGSPDGGTGERTRLGLLLAGDRRGPHWSYRRESADFFDAKGVVEAALDEFGACAELVADPVPAFLHPGRAARILVDAQALGWVGALHPELAARWDLRDEALVAELDLDPLLERRVTAPRMRALGRYPAVVRDLSLVCGENMPAGRVLELARGAAGDSLVAVGVTDRYVGPPVPAGRVSLTIALRFEDPDKTLTHERVQRAVDSVAAALLAAGAEMRGEGRP